LDLKASASGVVKASASGVGLAWLGSCTVLALAWLPLVDGSTVSMASLGVGAVRAVSVVAVGAVGVVACQVSLSMALIVDGEVDAGLNLFWCVDDLFVSSR
jgi:hypothetical protein